MIVSKPHSGVVQCHEINSHEINSHEINSHEINSHMINSNFSIAVKRSRVHNSNPININMPSKGCMLSKGQGYMTQFLSTFKGQAWITQVLYKEATVVTCYYLSSFNSIDHG